MKTRTFLTTLLLFLLFFNGAICAVTIFTLRNSLNAARQQCLAEHYITASALLQDMEALRSRGADPIASLAQLMRPYSHISNGRQGGFLIYQNSSCVYSSLSGAESPALDLNTLTDPGQRTLIIQKQAPFYLSVAGRLPSPFEDYVLIYQSSLSEPIGAWQKMCRLLYAAGAAFSVLLALCLLLLLNRMFRPLEQIHTASRSIAAGEYSLRLPVQGRDELAGVAQSFNHMADEIESQMAALNEAAQQKQRFVDNFAHELRTPLTAIYGYAEYLQKAALTEADKQTATGYILSECRRLQNMAAQLLETAVVRTDGAAFQSVQTGPLFCAVERTLRPKADALGVQLTVHTSLPTLLGDRDLLESLLINLADNALKACAPGGLVQLRAQTENSRAVLIVQDNGRGMSEQELAHVREAFYRADKARSRAAGGAGLGLTLCEQIATAHRARLEFSSTLGKGTLARVIFSPDTAPTDRSLTNFS